MASSVRVLRALVREVAMGMDDLDPDMALAVVDDAASRYYILYAAGHMRQALAGVEEESRRQAEEDLEGLRAEHEKGRKRGPFPYDAPAARKKWISATTSDYMRLALDAFYEGSRKQIEEGNFVIIAMMKVFTSRSKKYPQWGASTVELSAAESGWGPFMYDVVMSLEGGLVPDRFSVSDAARGVWVKYKDSRSDVEAKPLDDPENPRTKTKRDDTSRFYGDDAPVGKPPENPLNYAYFLESSPPDVSAMISAHRKMVPLLKKYDIDITDLASRFFSVKYHG